MTVRNNVLSKAVIMVVTIAIILGQFNISCFAEETSEKGSVTIAFYNSSNEPVLDVKTIIYRVKTAKFDENGNLVMETTPEFADCDVSGLDDRARAQKYAQFAKMNDVRGTFVTVTHEDGSVTVDDLPMGEYLITEDTIRYDAVPSLVAIPMQIDSVWRYSVEVFPKMSEVVLTPAPEVEPTTSPNPGNSGDSKLPQTGMLRWPIYVLSFGGIAVFVLGWIMVVSREKVSK